MSEVFTTHGAVSWTELMTTGKAKAQSFYRDLLGWTLEDSGMPGVDYTLIKVNGAAIGGIMAMTPDMAGMPTHWRTYITVDNVDERVAKATQAGGTIVLPPTDIPGVGRFAIIQDPTGGVLSLITYAMPASS